MYTLWSSEITIKGQEKKGEWNQSMTTRTVKNYFTMSEAGEDKEKHDVTRTQQRADPY